MGGVCGLCLPFYRYYHRQPAAITLVYDHGMHDHRQNVYLLIDERDEPIAFRLQRLLVANYFAFSEAQTNSK